MCKITIAADSNSGISQENANKMGIRVLPIFLSSCPEGDAEIWKEQIMEYFPKQRVEINSLPLSICCHTGAGAVAGGCAKKLKI